MSARRYRTRKGMDMEAAAYAVTALAQLAEDNAYPPQARGWAQTALNEMVTRGYIEPRPEVQS